jgi:urease accessory protein
VAETGIALSVVAFGLAAAFGLRLPVAALGALVGGFAAFHGYAHGAEMPETASGLVYGLGFLAGTALLHAAGLGLGLAIAAGTRRTVMAPMLGGAVVASGVVLLAGHF